MYNRKQVFYAAAAGIFIFGLGITTLGSIAPWLKTRFLLDDIQTGTLFSILPIGILTGSFFFGPIADRYGFKYLLPACCLLMCAGFEGIAFAGSLTVLKIAVFLYGAGGGAMNGASSAAVADISNKSKGANLSLLGLFFGIGALGMPFLLAILSRTFSNQQIIAAIGGLSLLVAISYFLVIFPVSKQGGGLSIEKLKGLLTDRLILFIAFFLFCQSSFEGIMNNWTTTYLIQLKSIPANAALYALSLHVVGYTAVRLLLGTVFRSIPVKVLMFSSLLLLFSGTALFAFAGSYVFVVAGLVIIGAGLSAGFPLMLGVVGERYAQLSGTAFSFVFTIALIGNMLVNYAVGVIANYAGIRHLVSVVLAECLLMSVLAYFIFRREQNDEVNRYENNKLENFFDSTN